MLIITPFLRGELYTVNRKMSFYIPRYRSALTRQAVIRQFYTERSRRASFVIRITSPPAPLHLIPRLHFVAAGQAALRAPSPAFDEGLRHHKEKEIGLSYSLRGEPET